MGLNEFLSAAYRIGEQKEYLNRTDLIRHTVLSFSREILESSNVSPAQIQKRLEKTSRLLCGWANMQYDHEKSPYENLSEAMKKIRDKNIVFSRAVRADMVMRVLKDTIEIIKKSNYKEIKNMAVNYLYAISHVVYSPEVEPNGNIETFLEELIRDLYKHNVLPKPVELREVELKRSDEFAKVFFEDLDNRILRNANNLIFIEGEHGVGKSYTALHLAREIDEDFSVEEQVVFDIPSFVEVCNKFKKEHQFGRVVVFDEVGVAASAMAYHDIESILFDKYVQLFRYLRLTVIFTARDMSDTIRRLRKRVTHYIVLPEPRKCEIYQLKSRFDPKKDKIEIDYKPYYAEDDYNIYLLKFRVPKVPKDVAKAYENWRDKKVTSEYLIRIEEDLKFLKNDASGYAEMARDFIEKHLDNPEAYVRTGQYKGKISLVFLQENYNIGRRTAMKVRNIIEKMLKEKMAEKE